MEYQGRCGLGVRAAALRIEGGPSSQSGAAFLRLRKATKRQGGMKKPYLTDGRLGDVIAAITVLGTYKFYKLDVARWADRITGSQEAGEHWRGVFAAHPEFFRLTSDKQKVSLVWRRQFPRNFNVDEEAEEFPDHEIDGLTESRTSRRPLTPTEVTELIGVAINLHDRALEQDKARAWWVPLVAALLSFIGALVGATLGKSAGG